MTRLVRRLFERVSGQPWLTGRSAAAEFGPPPGAEFAEQLAHYSDAELMARGPAILAQLRAHRAAVERLLVLADETDKEHSA